MDTLIHLSNGIVVAVIGEASPLIFDDNVEILEWKHKEDEVIFLAGIPEFTEVNGKHLMICKHGKTELNTWVKREIDNIVVAYNEKKVHIILCGISLSKYVIEYMSTMYPNVPLFAPKIFEINDEGKPICKIDLFIQYDKVQTNKSTI
jgi:hypothetical protein